MSNILAQTWGLKDSGTSPSATTLALSAATTRLLFLFIPPASKTLNTVRFFVSAVSGTISSNGVVCDLWSMPTGAIAAGTVPSASLESRATVTATPTGAGWVEVTGFTTALTAGTLYGLVIQNATGTPASNNFTARWVFGLDNSVLGTTVGWGKRHSTDSGTSYGTAANQVGGVRLGFSDGTYAGIPLSNVAAAGVGDGVYNTRESGDLFTTPANGKLVVKGIGTRIIVTGTPTGSPRFRLYAGTSLIDTTASVLQYASTTIAEGFFASPVTLDAATAHRMVLGETAQADASGNRFACNAEFTVENDADSRALLPFGGMTKTYFDGSSWTDTNTSALEMWLILDTDGELASSGGGGMLRHPGMSGGLNG